MVGRIGKCVAKYIKPGKSIQIQWENMANSKILFNACAVCVVVSRCLVRWPFKTDMESEKAHNNGKDMHVLWMLE